LDCQTAEIDIEISKYEETENLIKRKKYNKAPEENSIVVKSLKKGGTILLSKTREVIKQYEKLRSQENGKLQLYAQYFKREISLKQRTIQEYHY